MAPVKKKSSRPIGSMSDTIVQETEFQSGTNSENDLDDSDSTLPPCDNNDETGEDHSDDDNATGQGKLIFLFYSF